MPARVALGVVYHFEFDRANHIYIITLGEVGTFIAPSIPSCHATCADVHLYICKYAMYIHIYIYTYIHIYMFHIYIYTYVHIYIYTYKHMYINAYMHTYICTNIHINIYNI